VTHQQIEHLWRSGKQDRALRAAARIRDRNNRLAVVRSAVSAEQSPHLYLEMGHDPAALKAAALSVMEEVYGHGK
jgi:hypothetical protein